MVHSLYWILTLSYAIVLTIIFRHAYVFRDNNSPVDRAYRRLLLWCVFFCLQDTAWGLAAMPYVKSDTALFISSSVFHISSAVTANFWLYFVLTYLQGEVKRPQIIQGLGFLVLAFQVCLVVRNCFTPTVFTITADHQYKTELFREVAFLNQYAFYVVTGILTTFALFRSSSDKRKKYSAVLMFVMAPLLTGVFQLLYPDAPFYSVGTFIGCIIVHIFVVAQERNERLVVEAEVDSLTGVYNRNAYEQDYRQKKDSPIPDNMIFFSIDINGLKEVNDTLGHNAGDELIKGASECILKAFAGSGKVYRVGGDEFMVQLFSDVEGAVFKERILEETEQWSGKLVEELFLSVGFAERRRNPYADLTEMKNAADKMMYRDKENYYKTRGVDRRGQREAYGAICRSYTKILKVNLTYDTFSIIQMNLSEKNSAQGFSEKISEWLHDFGTSGLVHPDDLESYLGSTNQEFLRRHFMGGASSIEIFYRRRYGNGPHGEGLFRPTMMEMLPADDYSDVNQSLFLFVKDISEKVE